MSERDVIQIESDSDEDEDLRRAIELSLQDQSNDTVPSPVSEEQTKVPVEKPNFGTLQLDRKKMEAERLLRLGQKRPRAASASEQNQFPEPKRPMASRQGAKRYLRGTIKRTWARGFPENSEEYIKIEEVLQAENLKLALLSSFQWDEGWLLSKINVAKTKILLLASAPDEQTKAEMNENAPNNIRFCFPRMNGPGAMHSKLQILKFDDFLRIVIPTGNLVSYDWGETGVMENMLFLIDLPKLGENKQTDETTFSNRLEFFLNASGVSPGMIRGLRNYDFSQTRDIRFVCSIPGGHTGDSLPLVGYTGLGSAVKSLELETSAPIEVDIVCSSLGSINGDFVRAIYNACQGDNGMAEYNNRSNRKIRSGPQEISNDIQEGFRVYFPTAETVATSRGGKSAGGTICVQSKWWRSPTFPRSLFRDCSNNRKGLLMHSKVIFVRHNSSTSKQPKGWAYIGSANLSESAWGKVVKDKASNGPKLNCRNWECGVVIPVRDAKSNNMDMFENEISIPMKVPGRRYGDSEEPWFFQER